MIKSLYTEITSKIRCLLGGNYMKKRFLSVLLTLFMVLMMLPTTAYADTCLLRILVVNEVDIDYSNYEYLNAQFHQRSGYCQECGMLLLRSPRSEHNWSGTATCTSGQTCTVCGGTSNPRRTCLRKHRDYRTYLHYRRRSYLCLQE